MSEETNDQAPPPQDPHKAEMEAFRRTLPARPKMTLDEQAIFVGGLMQRCIYTSPGPNKGAVSDRAVIFLSREDYGRLWAIEQTLRFLDMHKVQDFIRGKIERRRGGGGGSDR